MEIEQETKEVDTDEVLFVKQLRLIKLCLDSDVIHEANRKLLSLIIEQYFAVIPDDNVVSY